MRIDYSDDYQGCFVCGRKNNNGLHLDFLYDEKTEEVYTVWKPEEYVQGFKGIVHGGFISMLCDEVMAKACIKKNIVAVTASIEVRFRKPLYIHEQITIIGKLIEKKGKKIRLRARCVDEAGVERASAESLFIGVWP